jgi:hypothetical protein
MRDEATTLKLAIFPLKWWNNFKYLGATTLKNKNSIQEDIKSR